MNTSFTKIIACLNPLHASSSVLDASFNIAAVFGAEVGILGTEEMMQAHSSEIASKEQNTTVKFKKIILANYDDHLIAKEANLWGADLIVKNADKYSQKLVNVVEFPVLTILEKFQDRPIKHIVTPLHDDPGTRQKIPIATALAKRFGATVHLIGVTSESKEEQALIRAYIHQVERFMTEQGVECDSYMKIGKKVDEETVDYAQKLNAEMIIIMNDREGGWFSKSLSEKILMSSTIPVMIVEPKSTTVSWSGY